MNEHRIGVSRKQGLRRWLKQTSGVNAQRSAMYLAMARQAQREGLLEAAEVLKTIV